MPGEGVLNAARHGPCFLHSPSPFLSAALCSCCFLLCTLFAFHLVTFQKAALPLPFFCTWPVCFGRAAVVAPFVPLLWIRTFLYHVPIPSVVSKRNLRFLST